MTELSLSLLGAFHASVGTETLDDFRTRKVQALLIYLAAESEAHSRDALLDLLWPGLPERSARSNLRQILYYLRQALPEVRGKEAPSVPALIANRKEIRLNPQADVTVDLWQFEALLDGVHAHEHMDLYLCRDCASELEAAVALYRGPFLSDFYLDDSNTFEDWAQARREHLRRRALDALGILTTMAIRARDYPQAQAYAEKQLEIDNLREGAYRQLMETLALSGRREQALAVYETCRRALTEELGMAPSGRTTAYYEKVLAGDLRFDRFPQEGVRGYELKEQIGEGAYGAVYRAVQPAIRRQVAVKVIARKHADDAGFIRRFEAEAQTVARLEHPYIVPLYDYWRDPQGAYLVMRYMPGGSLLGELEGGPWNGERAAAMVEQIASALAVAHRQGVVHRDIKPANILLDDAGNAYLADFGIARELAGQRQLTAAGAAIGTLDYVSPEQITGDEVSPHTDIYSLGAVLYETLTGEKPFGDATVARLLHSHLHEPIPLVTGTRPDVPPEVDAVLQKATAKEPAARYTTVQEMAAAFRGAVRGAKVEAVGRMRESTPALVEIYNPYKGLHAFQESDADDFFGREALVDQLVGHLEDDRFLDSRGTRFMAVVGPSGSGKSSAVKAGLIPALRQGALPGSDKWFITEMVPGADPLAELELALWHVAVDAPPNLVEPMRRDTGGILRTVRRLLPHEPAGPDGGPQLLLVIDQFEELFTLVEEEAERTFFLDSLLAAIEAPRSPLRVVVTLRADLYDRPLQYQAWGQLLKQNTEIVLPLNRTELTWAIREPAARLGVRLEEGLAGAIVADVADQPGALPLLQYTMTELFERRSDGRLTRAAYEEIGGAQGALGRRAEALYGELDERGREAVRQLFLRLVTLGEGVDDTRRRVLRSELEALTNTGSTTDESASPIAEALDRFGTARFLTFDRDPMTRAPTVEVAHEALLREWSRLRRWLAQSRDDVRLQRSLARAVGEWSAAGKDPGFLLRGARLDHFLVWREEADLALTGQEKAFLDASVAARRAREAEEEARRRRELETAKQLAETRTRAAHRLRNLTAGLAVVLLLAIAAAFVAVERERAAQASAYEAATSEAAAVAEAEQRATAQAVAEAESKRADNERDAAVEAEARAMTAGIRADEQRDAALAAEAAAEEERRLAEEQARIATSRELAAAALNNLNVDPERSILLAMHALSTRHTIEAENALHRALQTSRLRQTFLNEETGSSWITASPDGRQLFVSGPGGGTMRDLDTGDVMFTKTVPAGEWINRAAFSPDGSLLIMPGEVRDDGGAALPSPVTIVDADTGEELVEFIAHDAFIQEAAVSPDGRLLATVSGDLTTKIWDLEATLAEGTAQLVHTFCCQEDGWNFIDFSPDGTRLVTALGDTETTGFAVVRDVATGQELFTTGPGIGPVTYSPSGNYLVTLGDSRDLIQVWDASNGELLSTTTGNDSTIANDINFSADGTRVVTSKLSGQVAVWDFSPDGLEKTIVLRGHRDQAGGAIFSPDGRFVYSSSVDGTTRLWDVSSLASGEAGAILNPNINDLAIATDNSFAATVGGDGLLRIWNTGTWGEITSVQAHDDEIQAVGISPDGTLVATGSEDGTVKLWETDSWEQLLVIDAHESQKTGFFRGVMTVAFSPDGDRMATGGVDGDVHIWEVATGKRLLDLSGHTGWVVNAIFSPDGSLLATSSAIGDASVNIWNATTGTLLQNFSPDNWGTDNRGIWGLAFSPDGSLLSSGRTDRLLELWQLPTGPWHAASDDAQLLYEIESEAGFIFEAPFSPDGDYIAISGLDRVVEIRQVGSGDLLLSLEHPAGARNVEFTPDGNHIITSSFDGVTRVQILDLQELLALARSRVTRSLNTAECQQYLHVEECP